MLVSRPLTVKAVAVGLEKVLHAVFNPVIVLAHGSSSAIPVATAVHRQITLSIRSP
jgi:hypothetical protein